MTLAIVLPGLDRAEAEALVAEADTVYPYSHAVRGNIEVRLEVSTDALSRKRVTGQGPVGNTAGRALRSSSGA